MTLAGLFAIILGFWFMGMIICAFSQPLESYSRRSALQKWMEPWNYGWIWKPFVVAFSFILIVGIVGGICYGIYAGLNAIRLW